MALLAGCLVPVDEAATDDQATAAEAPQDVPFLDVANATTTPADDAPAPEATTAAEPVNPWPAGLFRITIDVDGQAADGLLAVPEGTPRAIVLVAHGWGGSADQHRRDLEVLAELGALSVAMDFRGDPSAFKVMAGVEDTLAATQLLQESYPQVDLTMLYGWSMGAEIALLAPTRMPAGTYDYVFAGAGVSDLTTFWGNPLAQAAVEAETGGRPHEVPGEYDIRSPVKQGAALALSGVKRVFVVHGDADPVVPVEASERLYQSLTEAGQATSFYVVTKDKRPLGCFASQCLPTVVGPADHEAGGYRLMEPFIQHRLDRLPDPLEVAVRGTYDGDAGTYDPSDVGPGS